VLACAGAALVLVSAAAAHVTLQPAFVEANVATRLSLETPNERTGHQTTKLAVEAPAGITVVTATAPAGWTVDYDGRRATWSGGRIEGTDVVAFPLELDAAVRAGTYSLRAVQTYEDGRTVRWQATLTVLPSSGAAAPREHVRRALVAGIAGVALVASSLFVLSRLRRRSRP
jgi:uncharacterized protein YcnI